MFGFVQRIPSMLKGDTSTVHLPVHYSRARDMAVFSSRHRCRPHSGALSGVTKLLFPSANAKYCKSIRNHRGDRSGAR